jgi:putative cardiolipin synthase
MLLQGCALPSLQGRTVSTALTVTEARATALGRAIAPAVQAHPGLSGIHSLSDPHEAFAVRARLARAAEKTLDVQYYIWHDDTTGRLMLDELRMAADRGVRVRLLLDDNGIAGLDARLAALDTHPNIEIRLFNPFVVRNAKFIGYLTDFDRANRRMHNKSFTADNQATIIGGRNIGDEYFGATDGVLFADLDVLAVGAVVDDVSADFDRYWASESSYPVQLILPAARPDQLRKLGEEAQGFAHSEAASGYVRAFESSASIARLLKSELSLEWAVTRMVSDDPAKGLGKVPANGTLLHQLGEMLGRPRSDVELISPYFVPTEEGVKAFARMVQADVKVRVLTNSFAATDVAAVHAGYAKYRKDLLKAGIILYEMRAQSPDDGGGGSGGGSGSGSGSGGGSSGGSSGGKSGSGSGNPGPLGSSGSSLHAKTFSVDQKRVFVGSFNFDPRSANLNTELGFVIESAAMARDIEREFDQTIPLNSYEVRLSETGDLYWLEYRDGEWLRHDTEPDIGFVQRVFVGFLSWLPIEWML